MKIGIDSEQISRMSERLLNKISTTNEREYVNKFKNKKPHIASLWTGKEAVIKVLGEKSISFWKLKFCMILMAHHMSTFWVGQSRGWQNLT